MASVRTSSETVTTTSAIRIRARLLNPGLTCVAIASSSASVTTLSTSPLRPSSAPFDATRTRLVLPGFLSTSA